MFTGLLDLGGVCQGIPYQLQSLVRKFDEDRGFEAHVEDGTR